MTDDKKQDERCAICEGPMGRDRSGAFCLSGHPPIELLRDTTPNMPAPCPNGGRCIEQAEELAALRAALEFERVALKLACGESVDLRAELEQERERRYLAVEAREREVKELEAERDAYRKDADYYRTAIERWYDLSMQKNINGTDGPTDEWKRAVDTLKTISAGESHD